MAEDKEELIDKLNQLVIQSEGNRSIQASLKLLGVLIPFLGPSISLASDIWEEHDGEKIRIAIIEWIKKADIDIKILIDKLDFIMREPSFDDYVNLLHLVIGIQKTEYLLSAPNQSINIILHSSTVEELKQFEMKGWLTLYPTGSMAPMGANNSVGNDVEDLKRPYGMGDGFKLVSELL